MTTATTPEPNVKRLIKLAEWASAQDARRQLGLVSEWDQNHWILKLGKAEIEVPACGTACCIAGKTVLEDGWVPNLAVRYPDEWKAGESDDYIVQLDKQGEVVGDAMLVSEVAQRILGLTDDQADHLFDGNNELEDVLAVIRDILAEAGAQ